MLKKNFSYRKDFNTHSVFKTLIIFSFDQLTFKSLIFPSK